MKEKLENDTNILLAMTIAYRRIKCPYYLFVWYRMQINKTDLFGCDTDMCVEGG